MSVTVKLIVWFPAERDVEKLTPVPICPSIFDVHTRELPYRLPSSASVPVPVKTIRSVLAKVAPVAGYVMVATGTVFPTLMVIEAVPVAPELGPY